MDDLISRQAAIDVIDKIFPVDPMRNDYTQGITCGVALATEYIKQLPSAQPEITDEQAIEHLQESGWMQNHDKQMYEMGLREQLADDSDSYNALLPSAQPERKKGKWQITDAYPHNVYCSECHKKFAQTHWAVWGDGSLPRNFCPNCGADMRGESNAL